MRYLNHGLLLLPTLICLVMGFRWFIEPAAVAPEFGFDLGSGLGRSSQIADLASFFFTAALCSIFALITKNRLFLVPVLMLFSIAAVGRTLAWLVHDASFASQQIAIEIIFTVLVAIAFRRLGSAA